MAHRKKRPRKIKDRSRSSRKSWLPPGTTQVYLNPSYATSPSIEQQSNVQWGSTVKVMADVGKYIEHVKEEEKRSHPFGVTNVLLNGLNGRKSKTTLDSGRVLTWICFFGMVIGICGAVIFLSARAATAAKKENCRNLTSTHPNYCTQYICCKSWEESSLVLDSNNGRPLLKRALKESRKDLLH